MFAVRCSWFMFAVRCSWFNTMFRQFWELPAIFAQQKDAVQPQIANELCKSV